MIYYLKLPKGYFFLNDNNRDVHEIMAIVNMNNGIQMVKGRWLPNHLNTALVYYSQKHQSPGFACSEIRYPLYLDALKSEHFGLVFKWLGLKKRETQNTHRCATSSKVKNSNFECYTVTI